MAGGRVDDEAGRLVHNQDVLILPDHPEVNRFRYDIPNRLWFQGYADSHTTTDYQRRSGPLALSGPHLSTPDEGLNLGPGPIEFPRQEDIEPLAIQVLTHDQRKDLFFFHALYPAPLINWRSSSD